MDEATFDSMSDYAESSTAALYHRNDDPFERALRAEGPLSIDDIVNLHVQVSPSPAVASSSGTLSTRVFSSHKPSTGTLPTSAGTSYPVKGQGKGKAVATYASSVSATQGSGSDTELEAIRDNALAGVGEWAGCTLKGSARARKRLRQTKRPKHKKPVVIIQQDGGDPAPENNVPTVEQVTRNNGKGSKYLRQRRSKPDVDQLDLAEQARVSETPALSLPPPEPLSRTRSYALIGLILAIVLTFSLFTFAAHHTGKGRLNCTKGIIFSGTVLISGFTVLAMVVARRALQEALLAGLLELIVGFALVIEIHDFM